MVKRGSCSPVLQQPASCGAALSQEAEHPSTPPPPPPAPRCQANGAADAGGPCGCAGPAALPSPPYGTVPPVPSEPPQVPSPWPARTRRGAAVSSPTRSRSARSATAATTPAPADPRCSSAATASAPDACAGWWPWGTRRPDDFAAPSAAGRARCPARTRDGRGTTARGRRRRRAVSGTPPRPPRSCCPPACCSPRPARTAWCSPSWRCPRARCPRRRWALWRWSGCRAGGRAAPGGAEPPRAACWARCACCTAARCPSASTCCSASTTAWASRSSASCPPPCCSASPAASASACAGSSAPSPHPDPRGRALRPCWGHVGARCPGAERQPCAALPFSTPYSLQAFGRLSAPPALQMRAARCSVLTWKGPSGGRSPARAGEARAEPGVLRPDWRQHRRVHSVNSSVCVPELPAGLCPSHRVPFPRV